MSVFYYLLVFDLECSVCIWIFFFLRGGGVAMSQRVSPLECQNVAFHVLLCDAAAHTHTRRRARDINAATEGGHLHENLVDL